MLNQICATLMVTQGTFKTQRFTSKIRNFDQLAMRPVIKFFTDHLSTQERTVQCAVAMGFSPIENFRRFQLPLTLGLDSSSTLYRIPNPLLTPSGVIS
jgi:hypothetical protein